MYKNIVISLGANLQNCNNLRYINSLITEILFFLVCGGTWTIPTGVITSPYFPSNYPSGRECIYQIEQPAGVTITLNFLEFDIESHDECQYDYLEVRDGDNENSTLVGRFCGDPTTIPAPIQSTHNYLWLK